MASSKKIRFGVLGCSRVAKKSALPALCNSTIAELRAVASRDPRNARAYAEQFSCSSYDTYEEVLTDKDIDAVYISLPNHLHEEWSIKAAKAGKHIWCEKPAGLSYTSVKKIITICKQYNVRFMEGFTFLYHPQHMQVQNLIAQGVLGDPLTFTGCFAYPMPAPGSSLLNTQDLGGGSYYDAAVYPIRASRMIFDQEPESIACILTFDTSGHINTRADVLLSYPDGQSAFISSAFGAYFQSTYSVLGSTARISIERAYAVPKERPVKIFLDKDDTTQEIMVEPADQFRLMIDDFCREILLGNNSKKDFETDALAQARILTAGLISHAENRIVHLSELDS